MVPNIVVSCRSEFGRPLCNTEVMIRIKDVWIGKSSLVMVHTVRVDEYGGTFGEEFTIDPVICKSQLGQHNWWWVVDFRLWWSLNFGVDVKRSYSSSIDQDTTEGSLN